MGFPFSEKRQSLFCHFRVKKINQYQSQGYPQKQAIMQAANDRIRPILMTVLTTILGLLPLSIGDTQLGGGGPAYFPMARAVIGGLAYSTITTLICLPVIYIFLDFVRNKTVMLWKATGKSNSVWSFANLRLESRQRK